MSMIIKFAGTALLFYIIVVLFLYLNQRKFLYFSYSEIGTPAEYGLVGFDEITLTTADGVNIATWYKKSSENQPTFVYFHGNGGNLANRANRFAILAEKGYGVLAVSYRGYGKSGGKSTEQGLYEDARAAIKFAKNQDENIILIGESLGTGVAIQMATEFDGLKGLVLDAPYESIEKVIKKKYFWLPLNLLLKDKYVSIDKIGNVKIPVLILHGELDEIVLVSQGKAIYKTANEPKKIVLYPEYYHVLPYGSVVDDIEKWLDNSN